MHLLDFMFVYGIRAFGVIICRLWIALMWKNPLADARGSL